MTKQTDRVDADGNELGYRARICVIIATSGRPDIAARAVRDIACQSLRATSIIVSCVDQSDFPVVETDEIRVVQGPRGLTRQRNRALRFVPGNTDVVVFFDDDFVPRRDWLAAIATAFAREPNVVGITGNVIADGIGKDPYTFEEAKVLLARAANVTSEWVIEPYLPYGCNMAFAWQKVSHLVFDERLVLYGWQEDLDFGGAAARQGRVIKIGSAVGVHLGARSGRVSGVKLGYSQVVNPIYIHRKGTMSARVAFALVAGNLAKNVLKSIRPEKGIDRRGRLVGNLIGLWDVARNRITPERAEVL